MKIFADLHIHSPYSRATSKDLCFENLEKYGRIKGLNLIGTGDITHPLWLKEIKEKLTEKEGIYYSKNNFAFVLQGEISLIYTQAGKGRRVHLVYLAPNIEVAEQLNSKLQKKGRLDYDGRPIFGISCPEFVEIAKEIDDSIEIIPAHIWTPWFSLFGSNSGFNSIKECFGDKEKKIYALETGMSSDPAMNERLSELDRFNLVSNSDSHSYWPWRIGRECNIMDIELAYKNLILAIREKKGWLGTIEVDPGYGKYHYDGHRKCNVNLSPKQALQNKNLCPVCKKPLTLGVLHRVEELADRNEEEIPHIHKFKTILPLTELISLFYGKGLTSGLVWQKYDELIKRFGTELNVLLEVSQQDLENFYREEKDKGFIEIIMKNREGKIEVIPGYDGEYGKPTIGNKQTKKIKEKKVNNIMSNKTNNFTLNKFF